MKILFVYTYFDMNYDQFYDMLQRRRGKLSMHNLTVAAQNLSFSDQDDLYVPTQNNTPLHAQTPAELNPTLYDGVTIKDMKDPGFAAAHFAPNNFERFDAARQYTRTVGSKAKSAQLQRGARPIPRNR